MTFLCELEPLALNVIEKQNTLNTTLVLSLGFTIIYYKLYSKR